MELNHEYSEFLENKKKSLSTRTVFFKVELFDGDFISYIENLYSFCNYVYAQLETSIDNSNKKLVIGIAFNSNLSSWSIIKGFKCKVTNPFFLLRDLKNSKYVIDSIELGSQPNWKFKQEWLNDYFK